VAESSACPRTPATICHSDASPSGDEESHPFVPAPCTRDFLLRMEKQIPPLRYAAVGMTAWVHGCSGGSMRGGWLPLGSDG
jgi:hypothetical protein